MIHDVVPDGLCPLGSANLAHRPLTSTDDECDPTAGKAPSAPYTTVDEQGNGTYDITWDKSTFPELAKIDPSDRRQLTFWTRTRENYQEGFANAAPVLSRDSVSNNVDTSGIDWVRCAPNDALCTGAGTKIDHDEIDGVEDYDVSGSGKAATGPIILKQVAATYPASGNCNSLVAADYGKSVPVYGPGDQVCWKLRLDFPRDLDTSSQDVFDILPGGIDYVTGTQQATANNTVHIGGFDTSDTGSAALVDRRRRNGCRRRWQGLRGHHQDHRGLAPRSPLRRRRGQPAEVLLPQHRRSGVHAARPGRLRAQDPRALPAQGCPAGQRRDG